MSDTTLSTIEKLSGNPGGSVSDYFALLKPRVMSLVIFTALVGMICAPIDIHPVIAATSLLCIAVGAGASGALNMWYDADIDAIMSRTQARPIPAGAIDKEQALVFGCILSLGSVVTLGLLVNWLASSLLAFTIFFYVIIYTMWLKRSTVQNIVIGGASGALPPVIGWVCATGSISVEPLILFMIIFMWTPPHFWALALVKRSDYQEAVVPMLPVIKGEQSTKRHILVYSILLAPIGVLPYVFGFAGIVYAVSAVVLGSAFILKAYRVSVSENDALKSQAMSLFGFSIIYLFTLFALLLAEAIFAPYLSNMWI